MQILGSLIENRFQHAMPQSRLPLKLSTAVLVQIELGEDILVLDQLRWHDHLHQWVSRPVAHRENVDGQVDSDVGERNDVLRVHAGIDVLSESGVDVLAQLKEKLCSAVQIHFTQLTSMSLNIPSSFDVNPPPHSCFSFDSMLFSASTLADFPTSKRFAKSFL